MTFDTKKILAGAISGLLAALLVDFHAWQSAPTGSAFDWSLAVKRWIGGAITGALAALGIQQAG